jgi:hypothetical protein
MQSREHYIAVAPGVAALRVDLEVKHGALSSWMRTLDPTDKMPNRPVNPSWNALPPGKYTWVIPQPSPGTWDFSLTNDSGWRENDPAKISTEEASYSASFSMLHGNIHAMSDGHLIISIHAENHGAAIAAPVADVYPATLISHSADFLSSGAPNIFPINVPEGSGVLRLRATAAAASNDLEAYLYDCTSGQCFFWDYAGRAAQEKTLTVHRPKSGRWVVAVNSAPDVVGNGGFILEEIVGATAVRYPLNANTQWQTLVAEPSVKGNAEVRNGGSRILYCELVDAELQNEESLRIADLVAKDISAQRKGPATPVAIASTVYKLE